MLHGMSKIAAPLTETLRLLSVPAVIFMVPFVMEGSAISVNSICELGDCASPGVLSPGGSTVLNNSAGFIFTFADGDKYLLYGTTSPSEPVIDEILLGLSSQSGVEYIGNSTGTAAAGTDTLVIDILQGYTIDYTSGTFYNAGPGYTSPPLGGGIAAGSSYLQQSFIDGQPLPALGPYTAGGISEAYSGTFLSGLTDPLEYDIRFTETFEAGSAVGSYIGGTAPVPEPTGMGFVLGGGLLLALGYKMRRRRSAAPVRCA
jgi:hypothetical protein